MHEESRFDGDGSASVSDNGEPGCEDDYDGEKEGQAAVAVSAEGQAAVAAEGQAAVAAEHRPLLKKLLASYTVVELKAGLKAKRLPVTGLKQNLIDTLADSRDMPPDNLLEYVSEVMMQNSLKPNLQEILTVEAVVGWLASLRR